MALRNIREYGDDVLRKKCRKVDEIDNRFVKGYISEKEYKEQIAIVINELRSVVPSSKMHGEKYASSSKKAIFDYIPEARHFSTWFLGDYQDPEDLYGGVKKQANNVHVKRGSC